MIRGHSGLECVLLVWAFSEWTVWIFTLNSHRNMPSLNHEISPGSINIGVFLCTVCVCVSGVMLAANLHTEQRWAGR